MQGVSCVQGCRLHSGMQAAAHHPARCGCRRRSLTLRGLALPASLPGMAPYYLRLRKQRDLGGDGGRGWWLGRQRRCGGASSLWHHRRLRDAAAALMDGYTMPTKQLSKYHGAHKKAASAAANTRRCWQAQCRLPAAAQCTTVSDSATQPAADRYPRCSSEGGRCLGHLLQTQFGSICRLSVITP